MDSSNKTLNDIPSYKIVERKPDGNKILVVTPADLYKYYSSNYVMQQYQSYVDSSALLGNYQKFSGCQNIFKK